MPPTRNSGYLTARTFVGFGQQRKVGGSVGYVGYADVTSLLRIISKLRCGYGYMRFRPPYTRARVRARK